MEKTARKEVPLTFRSNAKMMLKYVSVLNQLKKTFSTEGIPINRYTSKASSFMENGEKYDCSGVQIYLYLENKIVAIFGRVGKCHTKVWTYILQKY